MYYFKPTIYILNLIIPLAKRRDERSIWYREPGYLYRACVSRKNLASDLIHLSGKYHLITWENGFNSMEGRKAKIRISEVVEHKIQQSILPKWHVVSGGKCLWLSTASFLRDVNCHKCLRKKDREVVSYCFFTVWNSFFFSTGCYPRLGNPGYFI